MSRRRCTSTCRGACPPTHPFGNQQGHRGIVPTRRHVPSGGPVPSCCPCSSYSNTIRISHCLAVAVLSRLFATLVQCKTRRGAVADIYATGWSCLLQYYRGATFPSGPSFRPTLTACVISSQRSRMPLPQASVGEMTRGRVGFDSYLSSRGGSRFIPPCKTCCNDVITVKLHADDNRVSLPTSTHVR